MIITYADLPNIRDKHAKERIVFASGSYDVVHPGHLFFLEKAAKLGTILIVTVGQDAEIKKRKGPDRPVLSEEARLYMIDGLKPVDYSFLTNRPAEGKGWLDPLREIFEILKPDVYVVNSDGGDLAKRQTMADEFGVEMVILEEYLESRGQKISTTWIMQKIRPLE
jgi:cytidyltransferase-like protein